ncbi:hypothetical protein ID866_11121 [Astraeus odoratus]|nr:hypothetical protein ID866_11121 [Astraeus odoratus]
MEDWELVSEASLDRNSDDDKATDDLQKKAKEDCMNERRQKHKEEEQRIWVEAEQKAWEETEWEARQEAEWKKEEEWEARRAEEAKQRAGEAEKAAEAQRRTVERQHKPSMVIPAGETSHRSASGAAKGKSTASEPCHKAKASCSWSKTAGGVTQKWRRMEAKEDDGEDDNYDEGDETEGMETSCALLKEFKGYHHEQWDLQAHQVRGLKALQREMRKANTLKAKELEATTKGKEVAEEPEELLESGDEEEVVEGEGDSRDGDMEMGAAPSASAT